MLIFVSEKNRPLLLAKGVCRDLTELCRDPIELCRDLIELCRDLIELCRDIISTNHSTDNMPQ